MTNMMYRIPIKRLFEILDLDSIAFDSIASPPTGVYINSPSGYVEVLNFVKKRHECRSYLIENGESIECSVNHIVFQNGTPTLIKNCDAIDTIDGSQLIIDRSDIGEHDVYDVALNYPHQYVTPNGVIHHNTTIAYALANEIGADLLYINASLESGVDTIRTKIVQFASTASFEGNLKIILMDEADGLSQQSQGILRPILEEFSQNCRFILTCNYKNKIIDALHSRCIPIDFSVKPEEKQELTMKAWKRSMEILTQEGIDFDKKTVATIVSRYYPDMRRVLNALQKAAASGKVNDTTLSDGIPTDALYAFMKEKKFGDVRKWVAQNSGDYQEVFRDIYDQLLTLFVGQSIPQVVILLDMYQDRLTRVADPEITMMACLTEIMATVEWK